MIVCRRPIRLFDVDVAGILALAATTAALVWLLCGPWTQTWRGYRAGARARADIERRLHSEIVALEEFEENLTQLESDIASLSDEVPHADSLSRLLSEVTDIARDANLRLLSVAPQAGRAVGAYTVVDVEIGATGRSHDFIRFLDQLARRNPYQSLPRCTIEHAAKNDDPRCRIDWTIRLYLLPELETASPGDAA
jgi:hypothetical protein